MAQLPNFVSTTVIYKPFIYVNSLSLLKLFSRDGKNPFGDEYLTQRVQILPNPLGDSGIKASLFQRLKRRKRENLSLSLSLLISLEKQLNIW